MGCENCDCDKEKDNRHLNITYGELKEVLKRSNTSLPSDKFMLHLANIKKEKFGEE